MIWIDILEGLFISMVILALAFAIIHDVKKWRDKKK